MGSLEAEKSTMMNQITEEKESSEKYGLHTGEQEGNKLFFNSTTDLPQIKEVKLTYDNNLLEK